ncbi:hypothetical protein [Pantoea sp. PNA 03-3]|uniref:DUF5983 family protein n=1 Tax=Pantoea TaxID=53335 RepID=UPI000D75C262|nr:hypothetical protein [Pantoea sp. PNA 03-3]PXV70869.1 hypothetical protein C7433_11411 [Pantoea sp. PNA 03-3]
MQINERHHVAVISTGHMTGSDSQRFWEAWKKQEAGRGIFWVQQTEYGWLLRISASEDWRAELFNAQVSPETVDNIAALEAAGFDWIWFERDADRVEKLAWQEW